MFTETTESLTATAAKPQTFIHFKGVFDAPTLEAARPEIERLAHDGQVVIDLTHVQNVQDATLALLAHLAPVVMGAPLAVLGLREHQLRILRYLGLDPSCAENGAVFLRIAAPCV